MKNLEEVLANLSVKYNFELLSKLSSEDKESNKIYGEIISVLIKKPDINLYELIAEINLSGNRFEKNKIRNRRDRITGIHNSIDEAIEVVNLIEDGNYELSEEKLKKSNVVRDRMAISILLEENFSEEVLDLYHMIKNDQCRGFLKNLILKLKEV